MKTSGNWALRYKLHHIPFWFLYNFVWWTVSFGDPIAAATAIFTTCFSMKFLFYMVMQGLAASFNLYYLMPRFLDTGKFRTYFALLAVTIVIASIAIIPGYYLTAMLNGQTMGEAFGANNSNPVHLFFSSPFPSTIAIMTLAMSIKLGKKWWQTQRRQQLLEKEKLETELKFLRYQSNPHFLFNTINSIFFLIHKNPHMASDSLAKFSDMLRYQLYECNDKQIALEKEIAYLANFVELEKLRQNEHVRVVSNINVPADGLAVAPFILMTFVENAFKHVSKSSDTNNYIDINIHVDGLTLTFIVTNTISADYSGDVVHYGGIGLQNVQRRLDLVYPGNYQLDIEQDEQLYKVRLCLELTPVEDAQPVPADTLNYLQHA
ncbi:sensor histidine kinase [uncultured Chitinophaga sp.]|uniref:sensor histidine kinase n=1 Tax=uncultured Chitinophaga sp. TaxID=339340 RepID=UPI0025F7CDCD|nr:histidine kinase [uncultured Chitinophaga sp.]